MLETLFCSRDRIKILRYCFDHGQELISIDQCRKSTHIKKGILMHECELLLRAGVLHKTRIRSGIGVERKIADIGYTINTLCPWIEELRALIVKEQFSQGDRLFRSLQRAGTLRLFVLTGLFVGDSQALTDCVIVGRVKRVMIEKCISRLERELRHSIRFTVFSTKEFLERKAMSDRFIHWLMGAKSVILINKKML